MKITETIKCITFLTVLFLRNTCNAEIYLRPIKFNDIDATSNENMEINVHLAEPDDLRSVTFQSDWEDGKSSGENYRNSLEMLGGLRLTKKQEEMLRKSWHDSCDRKAAKVCRKACVSTYKIVCSAYLCKRSMKRSFKRECKRNCKARFSSSSRTDSE